MVVILDTDKFPSPHDWQQRIEHHGFPFELDTSFDPFSQVGYLPCKYDGKLAGFEYFYEPDVARPSKAQVSFVTHSNAVELLGSIIASTVLAELSGGEWVDTEDDKTYTAENAVQQAKAAQADFPKHFPNDFS
jgi:hypothetical protein